MKKEKLFIFLTFFIFMLITYFFLFVLRKDFINWEDFGQISLNYENFYDLYISSDHGSFISWVLIKVVGFWIPMKFGVHPNDNFFGELFRAIDFSILIFLISRFAYLFSSNKKLLPVWYLLAFGGVLSIFFNESFFDATVIYSRHFRYIFIPIFYMLFWLQFVKVFVIQKNPPRNVLFWNIIIAFCVGLSVECVNLSTLFSIILLLIIQMIILCKKESLGFKTFVEKILKIDKGIYLPLISFLIGLIFFYINPTFWAIEKSRLPSDITVSFTSKIIFLFDFVNVWFQNVFIYYFHWFFTLIIIVLSILILKFSKDKIKSKKVVLSSWVLVFGMSLFNFTLILMGKSYLDCLNVWTFWVVSPFINIFTSFILLASLFLLLGYFIECIGPFSLKDKVKICIIYMFSLILPILIFIGIKGNLLFLIKEQIETRKMMYKIEKMYVFYGEKNKTAILPESLLNYRLIKDEILGLDCYSVSGPPFLNAYYLQIYKKGKFQKIKLLPDNEALKIFYSNGGTFEPGEIKEARFTKLLNKDFVLNTKNNRIKT